MQIPAASALPLTGFSPKPSTTRMFLGTLPVLDKVDDVFSTCQTYAHGDRQASVVETGVEHGCQRARQRTEAQKSSRQGTILSSLPLYLDHQQLQFTLPRLLGGC